MSVSFRCSKPSTRAISIAGDLQSSVPRNGAVRLAVSSPELTKARWNCRHRRRIPGLATVRPNEFARGSHCGEVRQCCATSGEPRCPARGEKYRRPTSVGDRCRDMGRYQERDVARSSLFHAMKPEKGRETNTGSNARLPADSAMPAHPRGARSGKSLAR